MLQKTNTTNRDQIASLSSQIQVVGNSLRPLRPIEADTKENEMEDMKRDHKQN